MWGTDTAGTGLLDYENTLVGISWNNLFERMEKCFPKELSERYFELRKEILSKENIMFKFKFFESYIPQESFNKEVEKWGTGIPGHEISQIKSYLDSILPRLDQKYSEFKNR